MDLANEKLNSITADSLGVIRKLPTKRTAKSDNKSDQQSSAEPAGLELSQIRRPSIHQDPSRAPPISSPFGGDYQYHRHSQPAPPIGFKLDPSSSSSDLHQKQQQHLPHNASEESIYDSDGWTRCWYPRVMTFRLVRLFLFVGKIYADFEATKLFYGKPGLIGFFLVSAATLLLPTLVFTLYRVARYLQISLPAARSSRGDTPANESRITALEDQSSQSRNKPDDDQQLRRALISTPSPDPKATPLNQDDDGLVTARQTPTNTYGSGELGTTDSPKAAVVLSLQAKGIDEELANNPGRQSIKLALGATEQLIHGLMFIFWQFKRQVDVISYLNQRMCILRKPKQVELEELASLRTGSDGLEWFQGFYAAFLAILVHVYTLGAHWSNRYKVASDPEQIARQQSSGLGATMRAGESTSGDPVITHTARLMSNLVSQTAAGGHIKDDRDLLFMSELILSTALVFSLLMAVKRLDDGPLTLGLSVIGWGSLFSARIIIIGLAFVHIDWPIMLPLALLHIAGITCWIYKIAIDSHNDKPGESDQSRWEPELGAPEPPTLNTQDNTHHVDKSSLNTEKWTKLEHATLLAQIITLFSVPSLFYWPIMFNLKLHHRPLKYLVLILSENFLLIPAIWYAISKSAEATAGQWYLLGLVAGFSVVGFLFVSFYIMCKPSLTEYFARADELLNDAKQSGIYYEFCSRVFKMPDLSRESFRRLMRQTEIQVDEPID